MGGCACTAKSARARQACDECADVLQSPAERPTPASWRGRAWDDENQAGESCVHEVSVGGYRVEGDEAL